MKVSQNVRVFNSFYSANSKNNSLFDNVLNDMSSVEHVHSIKNRRLSEKVVVSEYHNMMKYKQASYIELNSATLFSIKNEVQNSVVSVDIKKVNSILAYSA